MYTLVAERPAEVTMRECDQDGIAAARFVVLTPGGELLLCGHHMARNADAIGAAGYQIDEMEQGS
jgi:hypothetical protein